MLPLFNADNAVKEAEAILAGKEKNGHQD